MSTASSSPFSHPFVPGETERRGRATMATINEPVRGARAATLRTWPQEHIHMSCSGCHVHVEAPTATRSLTGDGTILLTDRRVCCSANAQLVFLHRDALSALGTLQVPLHRLGAGKYDIPLWRAPSWQAQAVYSLDDTYHLGTLTIRFLQGGGVAFQQACTRAQAQWDVDRRQEACLRMCNTLTAALYEPPRGIEDEAPPHYDAIAGDQ